MSIRNVNAQAKLGEELATLSNQGHRHIDGLETLAIRIPAMKAAIDNPENELTRHLTAADKTAAKTEVDEVAAALVQRVKDLAAAL